MTQFLEVMGLTQNKIFFQNKIDNILERQAISMFFLKDTIQIILKIMNKKSKNLHFVHMLLLVNDWPLRVISI